MQETLKPKKFRFVNIQDVIAYSEYEAKQELMETLGDFHRYADFDCVGSVKMDEEDKKYARELQDEAEKWMKEQD